MSKPKESTANAVVLKASFEILSMVAAIEATLPASSTDKDSPLKTICLDFTDAAKPKMIATDSHWCAEYTIDAGSVDQPGCVVIEAARARKLLSMMDGEVAGNVLVVADASLVRLEIDGVGRLDCRPFGSFPETSQLWPKGDGKRISRVGMAPSLLKRVAKAFGCTKESGLYFTFFGDNEPILINSEGTPEMRAILMPLRQLSLGLDGKEEAAA